MNELENPHESKKEEAEAVTIEVCIDQLIDALDREEGNVRSVNDLRIPNLGLDSLFAKLHRSQKDAFFKKYNLLVNKFAKREQVWNEVVSIIISTLKEWKADANAMFPLIVVERRVRLERTPDKTNVLGDLFYQLCAYDAIFDLISGNLHRLDPVIQDSGCQWRVPFVVDAHNAVIDICQKWDEKEEKSETGYTDIVEQYFKLRKSGLSIKEFLKIYDDLRKKKNKAKQGKAQSAEERALLIYVIQQIEVFQVELNKILKHEKCPFNEFYAFVREKLRAWGEENGSLEDAGEYLALCKLLTVNRCRRMDIFGLSGVRIDYCLPLTFAQEEIYYKRLADYSKQYMLHVARVVKESEADSGGKTTVSEATQQLIGLPLGTQQNSVQYDTHVFYAGLRLLFAYQSVKHQPIIIDIKRLKCTPLSEIAYKDEIKLINHYDAVYELEDGAILYFEPDGEGGFTYVAKPSNLQMKRVGMCVECFAIHRTDIAPEEGMKYLFPDGFDNYLDLLAYQCPIVDMIMCSSSYHDESPSPIFIEGKLVNDRDAIDGHVKMLYIKVFGDEKDTDYEAVDLLKGQCKLLGKTTEDCHLWTERMRYVATMKKMGVYNIAYKIYAGGRTIGLRTMEPVVFSPIHIYGCTYEIKQKELVAWKDRFKKWREENFKEGEKPVMHRLMNKDDEVDKED
jgi:hypothetical protein